MWAYEHAPGHRITTCLVRARASWYDVKHPETTVPSQRGWLRLSLMRTWDQSASMQISVIDMP
jgi:hypothetical protein